jgi:hypothetical protein
MGSNPARAVGFVRDDGHREGPDAHPLTSEISSSPVSCYAGHL